MNHDNTLTALETNFITVIMNGQVPLKAADFNSGANFNHFVSQQHIENSVFHHSNLNRRPQSA